MTIKKCIIEGNFTLANREKNMNFIHNVLGIQIDDIKDILLDLFFDNYVKGPEEDYDSKYGGTVWIFKYFFEEFFIYIKLRYDPPDNIVCISFHEDE